MSFNQSAEYCKKCKTPVTYQSLHHEDGSHEDFIRYCPTCDKYRVETITERDFIKLNWHLHIGNKCQNVQTGHIFYLSYPYQKYDSFMLKDGCGDSYPQKDCKPICRKLDSITAVEQVEFSHKFLTSPLLGLTIDKFDHIVIHIDDETKKYVNTRVAKVSEVVWLIERGFYVGQFNKDECIIEDN